MKKISPQTIDQLFLRLAAIYPYKWAGQFENANSVKIAKNEWLLGLEDLSADNILQGLDKCRKQGSEFPPSIPEFRKMCLPTEKDMHIPAFEEAYSAAVNRNYAHPLIAKAVSMIGSYNFHHSLSAKEARYRFKNIFENLVDKFMCEQKELAKLPDFNQTKSVVC